MSVRVRARARACVRARARARVCVRLATAGEKEDPSLQRGGRLFLPPVKMIIDWSPLAVIEVVDEFASMALQLCLLANGGAHKALEPLNLNRVLLLSNLSLSADIVRVCVKPRLAATAAL